MCRRLPLRAPRAAAAAAAAALAALAAPPASARERLRVVPTLEVRQEVTSNVFYRENDPASDLVTTVSPTIALRHEGDRGRTELRVTLRSRTYWRHSELGAIDAIASGRFDRRVAPRLRLFGEGTFLRTPDRDPVIEDGREIAGARPDFTRIEGSLGAAYAVDALTEVFVRGDFARLDTGRGDDEAEPIGRRDVLRRAIATGLARRLGPRDSATLSLSLADDRFESASGAGERERDRTWAATASWDRAWTRLWSSTLSVGARWLEARTERLEGIRLLGSPGFALDGTDRSAGFVGALELRRRTERSLLELGARRETTSTSGFGSSLDLDRIEARYVQRLARRLVLTLGGNVGRYASAGESVAAIPALFGIACPAGFAFGEDAGGRLFCVGRTDSEIDATRLFGRARLDWTLRQDAEGRELRAYAEYSYWRQRSGGDRPLPELDIHRFLLGVSYDYPFDLL